MKYFFWIGALLFGLYFISCKNSNPKATPNQVHPYESAKPHSNVNIHNELSDQDRLKLGAAKGISASGINKIEVDTLFQKAQNQLHIFSFFHPSDSLSLATNEMLLELQEENESEDFQLYFFSLSDSTEINSLNGYLRHNEVTNPTFFPSDTLNLDWYSKINSEWSGEFPALMLVNQNDGVRLFYQKEFTKNEFWAILQPFLL